MKFGTRMPSLTKRIAARTSWKRYVRHGLGVKAPRGMGWLTNPRKAAYNRVYNRTSFSVESLFGGGKRRSKPHNAGCGGCGCLLAIIAILAVIGALSK